MQKINMKKIKVHYKLASKRNLVIINIFLLLLKSTYQVINIIYHGFSKLSVFFPLQTMRIETTNLSDENVNLNFRFILTNRHKIFFIYYNIV